MSTFFEHLGCHGERLDNFEKFCCLLFFWLAGVSGKSLRVSIFCFFIRVLN